MITFTAQEIEHRLKALQRGATTNESELIDIALLMNKRINELEKQIEAGRHES